VEPARAPQEDPWLERLRDLDEPFMRNERTTVDR
jgi:hypothetical protein